MRNVVLFLLLFSYAGLKAQNVYTIQADSVKLTGCDSSELIIENHTQNVPGFLFNTGNGRTIFRRGLQSLGNGSFIFGADTLNLSANAWVQGGNRFGATGVLGTLDNNHLDLYTNNTQYARLTNTGNFLLGSTTDGGARLQVNGGGTFNGALFLNPLTSSDGAGGYNFISMNNQDLIAGFGHSMIFQVPSTATNYYFQFGAGPNLGTPGKALIFSGNNDGNIVVTAPSNYIDLYGVQNVGDDASGLYLTSGGYSGMDGVVVQRNSRSILMTDALFTVRENSDTTVFEALKNGNIGVGINAPTAQLHTTGTVRLAGLSSDNTQTRVVVGDANGNLFYRDASTLAASEALRSSLAVNGPVTAKKLTLTAKDWPDYVFDSSYRLPGLAGVGQYIRQQHHLP